MNRQQMQRYYRMTKEIRLNLTKYSFSLKRNSDYNLEGFLITANRQAQDIENTLATMVDYMIQEEEKREV